MTTKRAGDLIIMAVGDVHVNRPDPPSAFARVAPVLKQGDINMGNQEGALCDRGQPIIGKVEIGSGHLTSDPSNVKALVSVGFKAMGLANNHNMDHGHEGLLQTIETLNKAGIIHAGGGRNLEEAHKPAILEQNGTRVALLSYTSVYTVGYPAEENRPGVASLKVHTSYEAPENIFFRPGCPPVIITIPDPIEMEMMLEDIRQAKKIADIVAVFPHWGIAVGYGRIIGYQKMVGRAAIDAGADFVLGSHPHRLLGMEMYKDKLICYSLGNFIMDGLKSALPGWYDTIIIKCYVRNKKIEKFSLIPARINQDTFEPEIVSRNQGMEIVKSLETMSSEFGTIFATEKDEVVIGGPKLGTPPPPSAPAVLADSILPLSYLTGDEPFGRRKSRAAPEK